MCQRIWLVGFIIPSILLLSACTRLVEGSVEEVRTSNLSRIQKESNAGSAAVGATVGTAIMGTPGAAAGAAIGASDSQEGSASACMLKVRDQDGKLWIFAYYGRDYKLGLCSLAKPGDVVQLQISEHETAYWNGTFLR